MAGTVIGMAVAGLGLMLAGLWLSLRPARRPVVSGINELRRLRERIEARGTQRLCR